MRHTTNDVVSTTRRRVSRMFRLLAVAVPLCLALSLSISLPAFAQQARQTTTARPNIPATCTTSVTKTLAGTATAWSDNSAFPGPATNTAVTASINLSSTGAVCGYSFTSFNLAESSGTFITVVSATPASNPGQFTSSTGSLQLTGSLVLTHLPLIQGKVTTAQGTLTTDGTITAADGTMHSGARLGAGNSITLVGTTSFVDFITVHVQLMIAGTFS